MDYSTFATLFIIITYICLGAAWIHGRNEVEQEWQEMCDRMGKTHVFRVYGFPLPSTGFAKKICEACGKQWNLYKQLQPFDSYQEEYDKETKEREREYARRKLYHEQGLD